jgi:hypothetical protein
MRVSIERENRTSAPARHPMRQTRCAKPELRADARYRSAARGHGGRARRGKQCGGQPERPHGRQRGRELLACHRSGGGAAADVAPRIEPCAGRGGPFAARGGAPRSVRGCSATPSSMVSVGPAIAGGVMGCLRNDPGSSLRTRLDARQGPPAVFRACPSWAKAGMPRNRVSATARAGRTSGASLLRARACARRLRRSALHDAPIHGGNGTGHCAELPRVQATSINANEPKSAAGKCEPAEDRLKRAASNLTSPPPACPRYRAANRSTTSRAPRSLTAARLSSCAVRGRALPCSQW